MSPRVEAVVSLVNDTLEHAQWRMWRTFEQTLRDFGATGDELADARRWHEADGFAWRMETIAALRTSLTAWTTTVH